MFPYLKAKIKQNRIFLIIILMSFLFMAFGWLLYGSFGHQIIKAMYEGRSIGILNKIIEGQTAHTVEFYFKIADRLFFTLSVYFLVSLIVLCCFAIKFENLRRSAFILLVLLLLLGVILRVILFSGYCGSDDGTYAELAYQMSSGNFNLSEYGGPPVFPLRIGLLAPAALGFKIVGPEELAMIIYPFLLSLCGIILAFLVGRVFFGVRAGLIAAMIQAILPIDVRSASVFLPDLPAAFWANLAILLYYYGSTGKTSTSKTVYGALSGFAFGLSWLCKETVLYLLPFVAVYSVWIARRQKRNITLIISAGLAIAFILLAESLIYYKYTNVLLYRYHAIERNYEMCKASFFSEGSRFGWTKGAYGLAIAKRILKDGPKTIFINRDFGLVTAAAMFAIGYAAFRKLRIFLLPGLWFIFLVFMFNFGSSSLRSYKPLVLFNSYLYPILLPAIVLTAGAFDTLIPLRASAEESAYPKRFFGWILILSIVFISFSGASGYIGRGIESPVERTISHLLKPSDPIYTDSRTAWVLKFFWKYPKQTQTYNFEGMEIRNIPKGAYVLINRDRAEFLSLRHGYVLPKFYRDIPSQWLLKWSDYNAGLYLVPSEFRGHNT